MALIKEEQSTSSGIIKYGTITLGLMLLIGLYLTSSSNYLLFHSLAEMFSIAIAVGVLMIAWNSRRVIGNSYLLFIGITYAFVAGIDLVHTLAYKGMGVFLGYDSNLTTQLWIAARYLQSISLLLAPFLLRRKIRIEYVILGYLAAVSLLLGSIFYWGTFPTTYVEGLGLTAFKKVSEYIISAILATSMLLLHRNRVYFDKGVLKLLYWSIVATIGSEIAFTFYVSVFGFSNFVGHILKILAFFLVYKAVIETGLVKPYKLIFFELKRNEVALRKAQEELESRATQLEVTNQELESFSYSVSHDLRAPLRAMDGFSKVILEDYTESVDETCRDYLHRIRGATLLMGTLIDGLLNLSHVARTTLHREKVNLSELARSIVRDLQQSDPQRRVEFAIDETPDVEGDETLLRVVMQNLLDNSWKFTKDRSLARFEFGANTQGGELVYFVRDNGVGFDQACADQLFAPFQRLHAVDEFPGTGIGLATVKRIIHRHRGQIWTEAEVDQGATFYFTL